MYQSLTCCATFSPLASCHVNLLGLSHVALWDVVKDAVRHEPPLHCNLEVGQVWPPLHAYPFISM